MSHRPARAPDLWSTPLSLLDRHAADEVRRWGRARGPCGGVGALHVTNYPRKPRGVVDRGALGGEWLLRASFCCARCRRRTTPPSVRFLARKVYVGALLVLFGNVAAGAARAETSVVLIASLSTANGIPVRTLERLPPSSNATRLLDSSGDCTAHRTHIRARATPTALSLMRSCAEIPAANQHGFVRNHRCYGNVVSIVRIHGFSVARRCP